VTQIIDVFQGINYSLKTKYILLYSLLWEEFIRVCIKIHSNDLK
jgi:hypothetical protein